MGCDVCKMPTKEDWHKMLTEQISTELKKKKSYCLIWEYDDKKHIQMLKDLVALCSKCHAVKHIGHAGIQASEGKLNYEKLIKHFMQVNNCDRVTFDKHLAEAYKQFEERFHYDWQLDLSEYQKGLK